MRLGLAHVPINSTMQYRMIDFSVQKSATAKPITIYYDTNFNSIQIKICTYKTMKLLLNNKIHILAIMSKIFTTTAPSEQYG